MTKARTRPLFEEPSCASECTDLWSGPKGFMFGGMFLPAGTNGEMAQQYFDAANLLVADIEHDRLEDYKLASPILYLYRHWLELMIKSIIGGGRGHNLGKLAKRLKSCLWVPKFTAERSIFKFGFTSSRLNSHSAARETVWEMGVRQWQWAIGHTPPI